MAAHELALDDTEASPAFSADKEELDKMIADIEAFIPTLKSPWRKEVWEKQLEVYKTQQELTSNLSERYRDQEYDARNLYISLGGKYIIIPFGESPREWLEQEQRLPGSVPDSNHYMLTNIIGYEKDASGQVLPNARLTYRKPSTASKPSRFHLKVKEISCSNGCYGMDVAPSPTGSGINWLWIGRDDGRVDVYTLFDSLNPEKVATIDTPLTAQGKRVVGISMFTHEFPMSRMSVTAESGEVYIVDVRAALLEDRSEVFDKDLALANHADPESLEMSSVSIEQDNGFRNFVDGWQMYTFTFERSGDYAFELTGESEYDAVPNPWMVYWIGSGGTAGGKERILAEIRQRKQIINDLLAVVLQTGDNNLAEIEASESFEAAKLNELYADRAQQQIDHIRDVHNRWYKAPWIGALGLGMMMFRVPGKGGVRDWRWFSGPGVVLRQGKPQQVTDKFVYGWNPFGLGAHRVTGTWMKGRIELPRSLLWWGVSGTMAGRPLWRVKFSYPRLPHTDEVGIVLTDSYADGHTMFLSETGDLFGNTFTTGYGKLTKDLKSILESSTVSVEAASERSRKIGAALENYFLFLMLDLSHFEAELISESSESSSLAEIAVELFRSIESPRIFTQSWLADENMLAVLEEGERPIIERANAAMNEMGSMLRGFTQGDLIDAANRVSQSCSELMNLVEKLAERGVVQQQTVVSLSGFLRGQGEITGAIPAADAMIAEVQKKPTMIAEIVGQTLARVDLDSATVEEVLESARTEHNRVVDSFNKYLEGRIASANPDREAQIAAREEFTSSMFRALTELNEQELAVLQSGARSRRSDGAWQERSMMLASLINGAMATQNELVERLADARSRRAEHLGKAKVYLDYRDNIYQFSWNRLLPMLGIELTFRGLGMTKTAKKHIPWLNKIAMPTQPTAVKWSSYSSLKFAGEGTLLTLGDLLYVGSVNVAKTGLNVGKGTFQFGVWGIRGIGQTWTYQLGMGLAVPAWHLTDSLLHSEQLEIDLNDWEIAILERDLAQTRMYLSRMATIMATQGGM